MIKNTKHDLSWFDERIPDFESRLTNQSSLKIASIIKNTRIPIEY